MSNRKSAWVVLLKGRTFIRPGLRPFPYFWRENGDMDLYRIVSARHVLGLRGFWNFDRRYRHAFSPAWLWTNNPEDVVSRLSRRYEAKRVAGTDTFRLSQADVEEIQQIMKMAKQCEFENPWQKQQKQQDPFFRAFFVLLIAVALYGSCSIPPECRREGGDPAFGGGEWVCD